MLSSKICRSQFWRLLYLLVCLPSKRHVAVSLAYKSVVAQTSTVQYEIRLASKLCGSMLLCKHRWQQPCDIAVTTMQLAYKLKPDAQQRCQGQTLITCKHFVLLRKACLHNHARLPSIHICNVCGKCTIALPRAEVSSMQACRSVPPCRHSWHSLCNYTHTHVDLPNPKHACSHKRKMHISLLRIECMAFCSLLN